MQIPVNRQPLNSLAFGFVEDSKFRRHHLCPEGAVMIRTPLMNPDHEDAVISQHAGGRIVGEAIHLETTILGNAHRRVPIVAAVEHLAVACGLAAGEQHHRAIGLTTASPFLKAFGFVFPSGISNCSRGRAGAACPPVGASHGGATFHVIRHVLGIRLRKIRPRIDEASMPVAGAKRDIEVTMVQSADPWPATETAEALQKAPGS